MGRPRTTDWVEKPRCDLCGGEDLRLLGRRRYLWPTRQAQFELIHHDTLCGSCGFMFNGVLPADEQFLSDYYADAFFQENAEIALTYDPERRLGVLARHQLPRDASILEVGANNGRFCETLRERGYRARGVDILESAHELVTAPSLDDSERFDAVVSYFVLEHVPDPIRWLEASAARCRPGGLIVIEVPDFLSHPKESLHHEHLLHFTPHHLRALARRVGLEVLEVSPEASRYFGICLAARFTGAPGVAPEPCAPEQLEAARSCYDGYGELLRAETERRTQSLQRLQAELRERPGRWVLWGANEIAAEVAGLAQPLGLPEPLVVDGNPQKVGAPLGGLAEPIRASADLEAVDQDTYVLICSPSAYQQIEGQIERFENPHLTVLPSIFASTGV